MRLREAKTLLNSSQFDGAIYLCGYAIELSLKAKICETLHWNEFPFTTNEFKAYQTFRTHDLDILLHLSGIESVIRGSYLSEWSIVSAWNPEDRYRMTGATATEAGSIINSSETLLELFGNVETY